jgi:hypothetical protein
MSPSNQRISSSGSVPPTVWGFLLLIPSLFLLTSGAKALMAMMQYKAPKVVSYAEFTKTMPKSGWYTIKGGAVDVRKAVYWEQNGVCVDVYAPLQPVTGGANHSNDIYVEIDDPKTLSVFQDLTYARKKEGEAGAQRFIAKHIDTFLQHRDVSGTISYGHRDPLGEWSNAGLNADTLTFVDDGWRPNPLLGYAGTGVGVLLTLLALSLLAKGLFRPR